MLSSNSNGYVVIIATIKNACRMLTVVVDTEYQCVNPKQAYDLK